MGITGISKADRAGRIEMLRITLTTLIAGLFAIASPSLCLADSHAADEMPPVETAPEMPGDESASGSDEATDDQETDGAAAPEGIEEPQ